MEPDRLTVVDLPPLDLRADVLPNSIDAQARTFDVVWTTGAPVERFDWLTGERYIETLSTKPAHVRLERLNSGRAPFLDAHANYELADVKGVVVAGSVRISNGQGTARVRMSRRADVDPLWQDIADGIIGSVSVGYRTHKYIETPATSQRPMQREAIDWEPYEISGVPMPADPGAHVRATKLQPNPCVIQHTRVALGGPQREQREERPMAQPNTAPDTPVDDSPEPSSLDPQPRVVLPEPERREAEPEPTDRDLGQAAERARIRGILHAAEAVRMPMSEARKLIDAGTPLLEAQSAILEQLKSRGNDSAGPSKAPSGADGSVYVVGADPLEYVWRGVENALLNKAAPQYFKLEDVGKPYRSRSLLATAEMCLQQRRIRTTNMTKMELAAAAFGLTRGGMHTTSDFANILGDAQNKILRAAYAEAPQTFGPIARQVQVTDFKTVNITQLGDAPALLKIEEHGEFTRGTMADAKETFALSTYGRVFAITRKALINDDLDAFARLPINFGRQARNLESDLIWGQIIANPLMADGVNVFAVAHGNYTTPGTAIDVTSLGTGQAAMRIQKGIDGTTVLNLRPRYLIVPTTKEVIAMQQTSNIVPTTASAIPIFAGRLEVIVEPRLDANSTVAWYLAASTEQTDMVVYGFLDGEDGPVVESRVGWDIDGLEVKCRHDVAAKVVDFRGLYKNAGA